MSLKQFFNRASEYLLLVLLFLLPWQTRLIFRVGELHGGVWEYGTLSLFVTEILLWVIVALKVVSLLSSRGRRPWRSRHYIVIPSAFDSPRSLRAGSVEESPRCRPEGGSFDSPDARSGSLRMTELLVLPAFAALSALWSPAPAVTLQHARFLLDGALLYWFIQSSNLPWSKLTCAFVAGVTLQATLGIWQFFSQFAHSSTLFGMAAHDPSFPGASVIEGSFGRWLRAYGGLPHPNVLGGYAVVALLMMLAFTFTPHPIPLPPRGEGGDRSPRPVSPANRERGRVRVGWLAHALVFVLLTTTLILTFSRSAWIAVAVGLGMLIASARDRRRLVIPVSAIVAVAAIMATLLAPIFVARLTGAGRLETGSLRERVSYFNDARALISRHPWFGVGAGAFTAAVASEVDSTRPAYLLQPVHTVWLLVAAELGVTGFLLFVCILWRQKWRSREKFAMVGTLLALTMFDHYLYSLLSGVYLLWISLGLLWKKGA